MDAALLPGTDADGLAVLHVAHRIGLGVLQRDEGNHQVAACLGGERLVLRGHILKKCGVVKGNLVAPLLEADAKHLLGLQRGGAVGRVNLDDAVGALALLPQYLKRLGGVVGGNDAVAHLALDDKGGGAVARVAQGDEVAIARHAVGSACTGISTGHRTLVKPLDVGHEADVLQRVAQGQAHGGTCRADVLERGGRGQPRGPPQLADQLPRVEGVEQIDVAGTAVQHFDG